MDYKKIMVVSIFVLLAVVSFTVIAPWAADPDNHRHSIQQTDEKIATVMKLSGSAAASSATLSLLPGDMCTPLSEQLAELAKYFLLILSALYLEKFLLSLSGYIAFSFLVPAAFLLLGIAEISGHKKMRSTASRIALVGLTIFLVVPASVLLSDLVYRTQETKVENTIEAYDGLELEGEAGGGFLNEITSITTDTIDRITSFLDNLLESLAVMIVTSCVIPLLVLLFLIWLVRVIFSANVLVLDPASVRAVADSLRDGVTGSR